MSSTPVDTPELKDFLNRIIPLMEKQLIDNETSHALEDYDVNWNEEIDSVSSLYNLTLPDRIYKKYKANPLSCTDISWNCTGNMLAVSYGRLNHVGWCLESGYVSVWNIYDLQTPDPIVIEVEESYTMKVAFHPKLHDVLAIGTYDGAVKVYRIAEEHNVDWLVASSQNNSSHRDPVTALTWVESRKDRRTLLASMSGDGKILLWDTDANNLNQPVAGYSFTYPKKKAALGASCFAFINIHAGTPLYKKYIVTTDNHFIIGTQVGEIHKAIFSASSLIDVSRDKKLMDAKTAPVKIRPNSLEFTYNAAVGYVHNVDPSPFDKNLFLTCSSDGMIRLYNSHKQDEIIGIQPGGEQLVLYDARWSPFRPLVLACGSSNGRLFFFDLDQSTASPVVDLAATENTSVSITTLRFSEKFREYLATGDSKGNVKIWQLNDLLSQPQPKELHRCKTMFSL
jgi:WD40 repeat protein